MIQLRSNAALKGAGFAVATACLFGTNTPLAKLFLNEVHPWMLAGLMYLGGGIGLAPFLLFRGKQLSSSALRRKDWKSLLGSMLTGGLAAPVLLMTGLEHSPAAVVSLLLNFESVFTALVAWTIFREPWQWRVLIGIAIISTGGILVSYSNSSGMNLSWGALAVLGTCLAWAIDSNLTAQFATRDPFQVAMFKSGGAGLVNVAIAAAMGQPLPPLPLMLKIFSAGFISNGLTYCFFVMALRNIGAARTGSFFALSPMVGAAIAILFLDETLTQTLVIAAVLMAFGATLCAWEPTQA
ncbi:DMT family transporter [Altericista sp. CCNU0014]|uniref:DMT family transporter n=1 Tax=Altericista sp. CCNU0014 TaxID=3082949 RepID=UPI00384FA2C0